MSAAGGGDSGPSPSAKLGVPVDERALAAEVAAESRFPWGALLKLGRTWLAVMALSMLKVT